MPMPQNLYTVNFNASVTASKQTLIQLTASSTVAVTITKFALTSALTAATNQRVQLIRFGTAATSMTSGTVIKRNTLSPTAGSTVATWASGQTDGSTVTILWEREIDLRAGAGWDGLPMPFAVDCVAVSGVIALYLPSVLAGTTALSGELEWAE